MVRDPNALLQATTYTEVSRIHTGATHALTGSLVMTSSKAGEGSTLMSQLMAQRSAENGRKTLIVDLNQKDAGLSNTLLGDRYSWNLAERRHDDTLDDLIQPVQDIDNLFILPAPLDPASVNFLKDHARASHFLKTLEQQFDHVVVDTTPINSTNRYNADPVILAGAASRTVLVILAGKTPKKVVTSCLRQLREAGANIEGAVLNNRDNPSLRDGLNCLAQLVKPIMPGLYSWLSYHINQDATLD